MLIPFVFMHKKISNYVLCTAIYVKKLSTCSTVKQILIDINSYTIVDCLQQTNGVGQNGNKADLQSHDWVEDAEEGRNIYFSPDEGNVVFASAYDGWGFT